MWEREVLRIGLDEAKDEYERTQTRIALVETKAQLISATVGILLTFFVVVQPDHIPHHTRIDGILLVACVGTLVTSLILSIGASFVLGVRSPCRATSVCNECKRLIGSGTDMNPSDGGLGLEGLTRNIIGSYLVSSQNTESVLRWRMRVLRAAQISLVIGVLGTCFVVGIPYLAEAIRLITQ